MTDRPRVLVTRRIPEAGLALVQAACDVDLWEDELPPPRAELLRRVAGVDGLLSLLTDKVDDELLDAAGPQLKVVSNFAVGVDNVDLAACARRGIPVGNTPGVLTNATADIAFALLMAVSRRLPEGYDYVRADKWKTWGPLLLLGKDFDGATLGVIGFGRIGQQLAKRSLGFGMRVLYHDRARVAPEQEAVTGATFVSLDQLLAESDFVSVHVDLNASTRGLMNAEAFAKMKPGAVLVNTSRGPVVDQVALYDALTKGTLFGAGLDVTDPEPLRADHPLLSLPNCLIVPHIASATVATRDAMARKAANNLLAGLAGQPLPDAVPIPKS